jgi:hypothetical protein
MIQGERKSAWSFINFWPGRGNQFPFVLRLSCVAVKIPRKLRQIKPSLPIILIGPTFVLGGDSAKLLIVAAWQLLNQLGSEILLRFPLVLGRGKAEVDCPDIWHSPIHMWQLPESLLQIIYFLSNLLTQASKHCPNNCCLTLVNSPFRQLSISSCVCIFI